MKPPGPHHEVIDLSKHQKIMASISEAAAGQLRQIGAACSEAAASQLRRVGAAVSDQAMPGLGLDSALGAVQGKLDALGVALRALAIHSLWPARASGAAPAAEDN